ncbi:VOC family protein [Marinomonas sp. 5E14-1]|uniref:VOC family protein n=1 Tax=Marinomonas sp. 5E14-1 TaxID=3153922 RepID=UPI00326597C0
MSIKYLHAMIRTNKPEESHIFYTQGLGLIETKRKDNEKGQFTLIYYATEYGAPEVELTHNWNEQSYSNGDQFGHLAFEVDNIYQICTHLQSMEVTILRPPRDGRMAFIKDPNNISIELLQKGEPLEIAEPWISMENIGRW